jgi:hypothetical protein
MSDFQNDKLVFYFEEINEDSKIDLQIFIVFDEHEEEYYITGLRNSKKTDYKQFKFYCKTANNVEEYISSIIDKSSKLNYTLYNFPNLWSDSDSVIDYYVLEERRQLECEIVGYDEKIFKNFMQNLKIMLKNLKNVRY